MATKKKDNKGPSTQPTGTQGVNAVGVNHGTKQVPIAPGFTDGVAGSPPYQQNGPQQVQQLNPGYVSYTTQSADQGNVPGKRLNVVGVPGATVAPAPWGVQQPVQQGGEQQVTPQTATNVQQNPVQSSSQTTSAVPAAQPVQQQQFAMPQQITYGGKTITLQPQAQPVQQQGQMPQQVTIGNNTYQMPTQTDTNTSAKQPNEPTAAQRNAEYEARKKEEAGKQQYNQLVGEYMAAGGNPNAIRQHSDPNMERMQPTAEQVQQAQANAQKQAQTDDDEYVKTLKEYLDSKYESPEDREAREKREARQRKWAAISEGIANVFNVGGSIAGARPAQWKGSVGELYANQEAEADKRRAEYRQALMDLNAYKTAIRNGNIAEARAIEERRKNDFYERKMLEDIASKQANDELKKQKQEADIKRNDQQQANRNEEHKAKMQGTWNPSGSSKGSSGKGAGGGRKKSSGGSKATGAQAAKSAKAAAKRRAKAATQGTKFGKK